MKAVFGRALIVLGMCLIGWRAQSGETRELAVWREEVKTGRTLPFSAEIGPQPARFDFVGATDAPGDNGWQMTLATYRERTHPLTVELACEFPPTMDLVRATLTLKAVGDLTNSVRHISILDLALPKREAAVYGQTGGFCDKRLTFPPTGSAPWIRQVVDGEALEVSSGNDGRSSNQQLPVWLYAEADGGLWYGPEWSGCWHMAVRPAPAGRRLLVGLPTFDFTLKAGETLTLPTAAFGFYAGSPDDGFNQLRRVISRDYLPVVDGKKPQPLVYWEGYGGHPRYATEEELYREADCAAQVGCEVFCLDGGWNMSVTGNWFNTVGSWKSQSRFPGKGVKAFGEYVKAKGMKFGVWIEPRATPGCPLYDTNRGLFYPGAQGLMRLDLPEGSALFQGVFEQLIRDYGVNWVWLDYNVAPMGFWKNVESADRKGLIELGFYQGWYRAIDETFRKHPSLWIESCASGGRIIDLAQLRRSQSIWVADEAVTDDANRNRRHALNRILPAVYIQSSLFIDPAFVGGVKPNVALGGEHRFLTYFSGDFGFGQGLPFWKEADLQAAAESVVLYKQYRRYLEGDYYHLLPMPASRDAWDACQYHDPKSQSGILLVYRLDESKQESVPIHPRAVDKAGSYEWSVIAGEAILGIERNGLTIRMAAPHATLIHYQRKKATPLPGTDGVPASAKTVSVTDFGAKGDGQADDAAAIQKALDSGAATVTFPAGTYRVGRTLLIGSGVTLRADPLAVVRLADGAGNQVSAFLLANRNPGNGNERVTVEGGIWDGNNENNTRGKDGDRFAYTGTALNFVNVKQLVLRNLTVRNPDAYSIRVGEVEDFLIEDITLDHAVVRPNQDGVHVGGFSQRGVIRRVRALHPNTPNDDMIALNADDDVERALNLGMRRGFIREVLIEDIQAEGAYSFLRLLSHASRIENITVKNVRGSCRYYAVNINNWRFPVGSGDIRNVSLENFNVSKTIHTPWAPALLHITLGVRNLRMADFQRKAHPGAEPSATLLLSNNRSNTVEQAEGARQAQGAFSIPSGDIQSLWINRSVGAGL